MLDLQENKTDGTNILEELVRFISCHQAYVRSISQYYIMRYLENSAVKGKGFLQHLASTVWKEDKDCVKIMRNVGMVV